MTAQRWLPRVFLATSSEIESASWHFGNLVSVGSGPTDGIPDLCSITVDISAVVTDGTGGLRK